MRDIREIKFRAWDISDKYEISTEGNVFSRDYNHTGKRKELRQYLDQDGYPYVFLNVNGKRYKRTIHRLVAELFLTKKEERNQVNHINGVRSDNRLQNLEWVTHQENVLHSYRSNGRKHSAKQIMIVTESFRGARNPKAKMTEEKVRLLRSLRNEGYGLKELARKFNISVSQVSCIAIGKSWSHIHEHPHLLGGNQG